MLIIFVSVAFFCLFSLPAYSGCNNGTAFAESGQTKHTRIADIKQVENIDTKRDFLVLDIGGLSSIPSDLVSAEVSILISDGCNETREKLGNFLLANEDSTAPSSYAFSLDAIEKQLGEQQDSSNIKVMLIMRSLGDAPIPELKSFRASIKEVEQ